MLIFSISSHPFFWGGGNISVCSLRILAGVNAGQGQIPLFPIALEVQWSKIVSLDQQSKIYQGKKFQSLLDLTFGGKK